MELSDFEIRKHVGDRFSRLTKVEQNLIRKHGSWMIALANRKFPPSTEKQEEFVQVIRRELDPKDDYQKACLRFKLLAKAHKWPGSSDKFMRRFEEIGGLESAASVTERLSADDAWARLASSKYEEAKREGMVADSTPQDFEDHQPPENYDPSAIK